MNEIEHRKNTIKHYQSRYKAMADQLMELSKEELVSMVLHYRFRSTIANSEHREDEAKVKKLKALIERQRK